MVHYDKSPSFDCSSTRRLSVDWYLERFQEVYGERIGQGRETAKEFLREHKDVFVQLKSDVKAAEINKKLPKEEIVNQQ